MMPAGVYVIERDHRPGIRERFSFTSKLGRAPDGDGGADISIGDQRDRLSVPEDMRDLAVAIEDVDRNKDDAEFDAGEENIDHPDGVSEINAQTVAFRESARSQQLRQAIATRVLSSPNVQV